MKGTKPTTTVLGLGVLLVAAAVLLFLSKRCIEPFQTQQPIIGMVVQANLIRELGPLVVGAALFSQGLTEFSPMADNLQAAFQYMKSTGIQVNIFDVQTRRLIFGFRDITTMIDDILGLMKTQTNQAAARGIVTRINQTFSRFNTAQYNRVRTYAYVFNVQMAGVPPPIVADSQLILSGTNLIRAGSKRIVLSLADVRRQIPNQSTNTFTFKQDFTKTQILNATGGVVFDSDRLMSIFTGEEQQRLARMLVSSRFCDYGIVDCAKLAGKR